MVFKYGLYIIIFMPQSAEFNFNFEEQVNEIEN